MRRQWLGWVVLAGLCVPQMRGDEASKRAKVQQLFAVMHLDQGINHLIEGVQTQTDGMMRSLPGYSTMNAQQRKLVEDYRARISALVTQGLAWKAMEPQEETLYLNAYSEQEIDGILAFYKSPVGQAMLAKSPELTRASLQLTQERAASIRPQLQATLEEFAKKYQAAGPPKPASPAGAKPGGASK